MSDEGSKILKSAITKLMDGKDLSREESRLVMTEIMQNKAFQLILCLFG